MNGYSLSTIGRLMDRSGPTRLRTPNNEATNGCEDQDLEACRSGHLENCNDELKNFTTGPVSDTTTTTVVLSRNESSESGRTLVEDMPHAR